MTYIKQLGLILAFSFSGEIIARLVPGGLPAGVTGMVLLLAALGCKAVKQEQIRETADFLSGIMGFFFLPAAAVIISNFDVIQPVVWQLLLIGVFCTFFTFFVTYAVVRVLRMTLGRKR